jgi:hypothetical protein
MTTAPLPSERGAALVEFALALPLLLVVIGGIVDFGFLFQRYEVLTNAAREGARLASLPGYVACPSGGGAATAPGIVNRVRSYVQTGLSLSNASMSTVMPSGSVVVTCGTMAVTMPSGTTNVNTVTVTATYNHTFILLGPALGLINKTWSNTRNLSASSTMRLEAQTIVGS